MPRKGKLERVQPSSPSSPANKYGRWRDSVQEQLAAQWQRSPIDVESVAATIVGMFDAGASDAEVAAFLRTQELAQGNGAWLTDDDRKKLVRDLHSSAGSTISTRPSNEES